MTLTNTSSCPLGQFSVPAGGLTVRLPEIEPFLPEVNWPNALIVPVTSCLFTALGHFCPSVLDRRHGVAEARDLETVLFFSFVSCNAR